MSVQEQVPYVEYVGNGVTKAFPVTFDCDDQDDLRVLINEIDAIEGDWQLINDDVVFNIAPVTNAKISITRNTALERTTNYSSYNNSFRPETINKDFDRIWMKLQELGLADWLLSKRLDIEIQDRIAADIYYYTLISKETDLKLDQLKSYIDRLIKDTNNKTDDLKNYIDALVNNIVGGEPFLPITDMAVETWSGCTQHIKNQEIVSCQDFGVVIGSNEDQTEKMDNFLSYLRENKCKGIIPNSGRILLTANKTIDFGKAPEANFKRVKYALDISGVDIEGIYKGHENQDGTILDAQNTGSVFMQAQVDLNNTTYSIKGFRVENADVALTMTYALFCNIIDITYKNCVNAIIVGDPTISAGAMCNYFKNIHGTCSGAPLQLLGKQWNNANQFHNCFFTGGEASLIDVIGGYGAIGNSFYGGEFNGTKGSKNSGLIIKNSRNTSFYNTYFEPRGHAIILDGQAKKVLLSNCTYGTTRIDSTESTQPSIIWHKSAAASITVIGGSVFLGDDSGLQDNMRFIYSDDPENFQCEIVSDPYAFLTGTKGWKIADILNVSRFSTFRGCLSESVGIEFSSEGSNISELHSDSKVTYSINGSVVTVIAILAFKEGTKFHKGEYYLRLLFNPKSESMGILMYSKVGSGNFHGMCSIAHGNKNLFLWYPTIEYEADDLKVVFAHKNIYMNDLVLTGYNTIGSKVVCKIDFMI